VYLAVKRILREAKELANDDSDGTSNPMCSSSLASRCALLAQSILPHPWKTTSLSVSLLLLLSLVAADPPPA
jgi:hypothetical protein